MNIDREHSVCYKRKSSRKGNTRIEREGEESKRCGVYQRKSNRVLPPCMKAASTFFFLAPSNGMAWDGMVWYGEER
jgi:hypothetical protein